MSTFPATLVNALRVTRHLMVFTGAGVSAESGISTFRDSLSGLWARFDPARLATPEAFEQDPALVWGWYEWRRQQVLKALPNAAHRAIAALETQVPKLTLVTQNVDDLHERAGSAEVIHLHGSLQQPRCAACGALHEAAPQASAEAAEGQRLEPPACEVCGGVVRPGVVWFGESLPGEALQMAFDTAGRCDGLLSIGTSGLVQPAAAIPQVAAEQGAWVAHINLEPVAVRGRRQFSLEGPAGEVLPALLGEAFD
ncbi:MAG: NAD-dependent protein deacylase [Pseudomonas citronellolis]|nr:MAG: NAD-dependent protein deacylase [Pseudomonas citronellolis]